MKEKVYLGDSVYVQWEGEDLILTTEWNAEISNTVILEPIVLKNLIAFIDYL